MKAPDKIYLAESDNINGEVISNFASSTPFRRHSSIAYIRKDALLDKLNLALKLRGDGNPDSNDDGIQTIKAMINYIESL